MIKLQILICTFMFKLLDVSLPAKTEACSPTGDFHGAVKKLQLIFKMYVKFVQKYPCNQIPLEQKIFISYKQIIVEPDSHTTKHNEIYLQTLYRFFFPSTNSAVFFLFKWCSSVIDKKGWKNFCFEAISTLLA